MARDLRDEGLADAGRADESELATMISNNNGSDDVQEIHSSLKNRYAHLIHRTMRSDVEKGQ